MAHQTEPETTEDQTKKEFSTREELLIAAVAVLLLIVIGTWLWLVVDAKTETKVEVLKAFTALATPAVVLVGLKYTKEALEVNRGTLKQTAKSVENASKKLDLDRDSKTDELFYNAAEHLGEDKSASQRVAALYTLERLSQKYPDYYAQCIQVICGFARTMPSTQANQVVPREPQHQHVISDELNVTTQILSRREHRYLDGEDWKLDLSGVDFSGMKFIGADFESASFRNCIFNHTDFESCNFGNCDFQGAIFDSCTAKNTYFNGSQNMMLSDGSLNVFDDGLIKHPLQAVRGDFPSHFALLNHHDIRQPDLAPIALTLAGVGFTTTKDLEPLMADWGHWLRFLYPENDKENHGWWLEPVPMRDELLTERWYMYKEQLRQERQPVN